MTDNTGKQGDTQKHLIEELDQLHVSLHDGEELQRDIPLLNEPLQPDENDFDLDIPILTDSCDDETPPEQSADSPLANTGAEYATAEDSLSTPAGDSSIDATDELDSLLDELIADHLPKLEEKLRGRLREMIQQGQLDLLDNPDLNNHVDEG